MERRWLNHYPPEIPSHAEYEVKPLFTYLKEAAALRPNHTALHFLGKDISYASLYSQCKSFANGLLQLGLQKGDRVAIMLPNSPQSVIAYYGALMAGGVVVQTNPLYTERELSHQLADSGATFIVCLDKVFARVAAVKEMTSLRHLIVTGIQDYLPFPKNVVYPFVQKKQKPHIIVDLTYGPYVHAFKKMVSKSSDEDVSVSVDPMEDLALLQYTGGTTGAAKGVMLTHANLVINAKQCLLWTHRDGPGDDIVLAALPFFHVYGMTVCMNQGIMTCSTLVILPKFEAKEVLETIHKKRPTLFPGAPTMYIALLNHKDVSRYDLSSIQACISGSASLPSEVQQKFQSIISGSLVEGYGMTETSPVTHANLIHGKQVKGSIGIPWPDTEAGIYSSERGEFVAPGEVGELLVKGPQVMKGYWNQPEETAAVMQDGWLMTGDMGYMDEEGYFYIVDRKKDMIIAGGFNIYPRDVEEVLYEHEAIQEAVVLGVPDPYRGETVKAYIVVKSGATVTEEALNTYCRKHLAAYKVPRLYEFREELPKTMVGKILRRALLEEEKEKQKQEV
ncbi:long-chain-fatty-acid--CoA ligase [Fictibacillus macauensis ZFHKF-1]|uniref:Long-chain-fatty-acid--CoA ligase n=1 Tax=Fictibacillus macauensis ZFHKF-1 TaxID=1196324 RepID=I8UF19_9BACL|nr:long-chain-fatty-acid--CoA ligase [Fictibacillus macauensis]EIT85413.1 long-chain-fatty-acid--CoA ligase [Fictibacillus macauensis ZFHKF-1]